MCNDEVPVQDHKDRSVKTLGPLTVVSRQCLHREYLKGRAAGFAVGMIAPQASQGPRSTEALHRRTENVEGDHGAGEGCDDGREKRNAKAARK